MHDLGKSRTYMDASPFQIITADVIKGDVGKV